ncbi:MAG: hypothetical protein H0A75_01515 [Candidatus Methanofishera endochildressiae]|uniref:6-phosphogluconate dehydrogenase NADP-binding domain-containing protein n=1 Tax=Candidatus Methanofishera endochildressiae TaxID=2738884 RepID=A0A7Z0MN91_9GAMM|nr:hypothetical protein [Candidatus Methanofishera endochildressiae]
MDLSSTHPETTRQLAQLLQQNCNMDWVWVACLGGVPGPKNGPAFMAGGN